MRRGSPFGQEPTNSNNRPIKTIKIYFTLYLAFLIEILFGEEDLNR